MLAVGGHDGNDSRRLFIEALPYIPETGQVRVNMIRLLR